MERIGFILHGKIRGKKLVKELLTKRFSADYTVIFYETRHTRHAEELTGNALRDGSDFVIAVGGDGTLNEMVNGFLKAGGAGTFPALLGVLPYGTGNDFARGMGIQRSVDQLWDLVRQRQHRMLDAGSMQFRGSDGAMNIRYFDNIADLGIGGDVVARVNGVHLRKKILGGKLTFFLSILTTFLTYKHKKITVSWEGFRWEGSVLSLVVANGRYFGSGLGIAPDADPADGLFEVVIFANLSILDYLKNYKRLRNAQRINHPEVFYHRTSQLLIEPGDGRVIVEADGEIEGQAPIIYTCLPAVLPFMVP